MSYVMCFLPDYFFEKLQEKLTLLFKTFLEMDVSGVGGWMPSCAVTGPKVTQLNWLMLSGFSVSQCCLPWHVRSMLSSLSTWQERWPKAAPSRHPHGSQIREESQQQRSPPSPRPLRGRLGDTLAGLTWGTWPGLTLPRRPGSEMMLCHC